MLTVKTQTIHLTSNNHLIMNFRNIYTYIKKSINQFKTYLNNLILHQIEYLTLNYSLYKKPMRNRNCNINVNKIRTKLLKKI